MKTESRSVASHPTSGRIWVHADSTVMFDQQVRLLHLLSLLREDMLEIH